LNMRTEGVLADILQGMRDGLVSDDAWKALQGRVLGMYTTGKGRLQRYPAGMIDPRLSAEPFLSHPISYIVHRHQLRVCQPFCNAVASCQRASQRLYVSVACDDVAAGGEQLTDEIRALLFKRTNLRQVQNLPSALSLYLGMALLLYSKECVRLQLMNGCLCYLVEIMFAEEETPPSFVHAGDPILLEYMPTHLLLRAKDAMWTLPESQLPDLPEGFDRKGLFLLGQHSVYFKVLVGQRDAVASRGTHFQVVPADTRIVYAAQGEGYKAYVADLARPPRMSAGVHIGSQTM